MDAPYLIAATVDLRQLRRHHVTHRRVSAGLQSVQTLLRFLKFFFKLSKPRGVRKVRRAEHVHALLLAPQRIVLKREILRTRAGESRMKVPISNHAQTPKKMYSKVPAPRHDIPHDPIPPSRKIVNLPSPTCPPPPRNFV